MNARLASENGLPIREQVVTLMDEQPKGVSPDEFLSKLILSLMNYQSQSVPTVMPVMETYRAWYETQHTNGADVQEALISEGNKAKPKRPEFDEDGFRIDYWDDDFVEEDIPPQPEFEDDGRFQLDYWDDDFEEDIPQEPPRTPEGDKIARAALEELRNLFPPIDRDLARYIAESPELDLDYKFQLELMNMEDESYNVDTQLS